MAELQQGILPADRIVAMTETRAIGLDRPLDAGQVQPASLDLRLGETAYRVRASFLPGPDTIVEQRLARLKLHQFGLADGAVLETGCVYIVPLLERLRLPKSIAAAANPKSSTGRLDVFTRVITDRAREFDAVPEGYDGPLYIEISPRTFPILVRAGSRLTQMRFRQGAAKLDDAALRALHAKQKLVDGEAHIDNGLTLSIDLDGAADARGGAIVGYRAKRHTAVVDVDRRDAYDPLDFFE